MSFLDSTLLAKALLHSLWQGGLLLALVWLVLQCLSESRTQLRYCLSLGAMFFIPLCCVGTYSYFDFSVTRDTAHAMVEIREAVSLPEIISISPATQFPSTSFPANIPEYTNYSFSWTSWVCNGWYLGVVLMLLRIARDFKATRRFQNDSYVLSDGAILNTLRNLEQRMGLRKRTRLLIHNTLPQPGALGILRPTILLPVSALTGLSSDQLEAILAHELAHIRRHDYFINIAQSIIEALFFFNPFVWILSRMVRFERETCCDQLAACTLDSTPNYARALLEAVEVFQAQSIPLLSTLGADKSSSFRERFRRLIRPSQGGFLRLRGRSLVGLGVTTALLIALFTFLTHQTVFFTAGLLSPEERVEIVVEMEREAFKKKSDFREPVHIMGRVVSRDGTTIHEPIRITFKTLNYTGRYACDSNTQTFDLQVHQREVRLVVESPGYMPKIVGPFTVDELGIADMEIVLDKVDAPNIRLQLLNENNEPLSNVAVVGGYLFSRNYFSQNLAWKSDSQGIVAYSSIPEVPIWVRVEDYTFDEERIIVETQDDGLSKVVVKNKVPLKTVTGTVYSGETGEVVSGAEIRLVYGTRRNNTRTYTLTGEVLGGDVVATTDSLGLYSMQIPVPEYLYIMSVKAEGYPITMVYDVQDTDGVRDVTLELPVVVEGRLEHFTGELPEMVYARNRIRGGRGVYINERTEVVEGRFRFDHLTKRKWSIGPERASSRYMYTIEEGMDEVVIYGPAVPDPPLSGETIRVQVNMVVPKDYPLPHGVIGVNYYVMYLKPGLYKNRVYTPLPAIHDSVILEVKDGVAWMEVPKECVKLEVTTNARNSDYTKPTTGMLGYLVYETTIDTKDGVPTEINVQCEPVGMVRVKVVDSEGKKVSGAYISVRKAVKEGAQQFPFKPGPSKRDGDAMVFSRIPFNEPIYFLASYKGNAVAGKMMKLKERNPFVDYTIKLPKKFEVLSGVVVDSDGIPIPNMRYRLSSNLYTVGYSGERKFTDAEGRFHIEPIYPGKDTTISLQIGQFNSVKYKDKRIKINDFDKELRVELENREE